MQFNLLDIDWERARSVCSADTLQMKTLTTQNIEHLFTFLILKTCLFNWNRFYSKSFSSFTKKHLIILDHTNSKCNVPPHCIPELKSPSNITNGNNTITIQILNKSVYNNIGITKNSKKLFSTNISKFLCN